MDFTAARTSLVDSQVRPNDVTDRRLIGAMTAVPREVFVPANRSAAAYADIAVETVPGRWLMTARDFSKLVTVAGLRPEDRVLDIAPGTGYSSAVLVKLAASVVALEQDEATAAALKEGLAAAGVSGVETVTGSLKAGAPGKGPFDVIFVNGSVEEVPAAWLAQLAEGGRLAVAVSEGGVCRARLYTASGGKTAWRTPFDAPIPALPGFELAPEFRF